MKENRSDFKYLKAEEGLQVWPVSSLDLSQKAKKKLACFLRGKNVYSWQKIYKSRFQLNKITFQIMIMAVQV